MSLRKNSDLECIQKIWPDITSEQFSPRRYAAFIKNIRTHALCAAGTPPVARGLDEALDLIVQMRQNHSLDTIKQLKRGDLIARLANEIARSQTGASRGRDHDCILRTACVSLSIMLSTGVKLPDAIQNGIAWNHDATISDLITDAFDNRLDIEHKGQEISPKLTLEYLKTYHQFELIFTDHLSEHLEIDRKIKSKPVIRVYKHKIFLWNELRFNKETFLPKSLIQETLRTLNLLFPFDDKPTKVLLTEYGMQEFYNLGWCEVDSVNSHEIGSYRYYGQVITELSTVVQQNPTGFRQILPGRDLSNFRDSMTFWVTVVIVSVISGVSLILGVLSYVVSKEQLKLGRLQYELSLAQACATMNSSQLPGWC